MTNRKNELVINKLKDILTKFEKDEHLGIESQNIELNEYDYWAIDMAIKTLEQEPVLDKIRAEIQNGTHHFLDGEPIIEIKEVLQIIDKYKAESEVEQ